MLLGEILLKNQLISSSQLEEIIRLQANESKKLGELLIERRLVGREQIEQALQEQYWRNHGYWVIAS
jgi:hypothetical protein